MSIPPAGTPSSVAKFFGPSLDLQKEIYAQTQNWVRHYETLIIAVNTVLLSADGAIAATFGPFKLQDGHLFFSVAICISIIAIIITMYLNSQYREAITRVVVYESYLGLHDLCPGIEIFARKYAMKGKTWEKTFVPEYLDTPPKFGAQSTLIFVILHGLILFASIVAFFLIRS